MNLSDSGAERGVLSTIVNNGKDALIEVEDILSPEDFVLPINRAIFSCVKELDSQGVEIFDVETIKLKSQTLGLGEHFDSTQNLEYLELLDTSALDVRNIRKFATQIKKLSLARSLYKRHGQAQSYLSEITGDEQLSEILGRSEELVVDFVNDVDDKSSKIEKLGEDLSSYIEALIEQGPVDSVGIPVGFPIWEDAIGGIRRGSVQVICSRSKVGKSFLAMNYGINAAQINIPTLYLDSELTEDVQKDRGVCIVSGCPIHAFERGYFAEDTELKTRVESSAKVLENLPLYYKSISGMSLPEVIMFIRKWLVKTVGFDRNGKANDCLIIYDYFKLTTGEGLSSSTPENILLGLMLTQLYSFTLKYDLPMIAFSQLNREGIESESTSAVAQSDRILWLCSSLSYLKDKDEHDVSLNCGPQFGNKKMLVIDTRHGSGLKETWDYVNLHAKLRPNVSKLEGNGRFKEGHLFSDLAMISTSEIEEDDTTANN